MIEQGYSFISYERETIDLICSKCSKHLGTYNRVGDKEYDDTKDWNYCPYCGAELR